MSKYGQWFGNSDYQSGYGGGSGKRKRDDYYSDGGRYASGFTDTTQSFSRGASGYGGSGSLLGSGYQSSGNKSSYGGYGGDDYGSYSGGQSFGGGFGGGSQSYSGGLLGSGGGGYGGSGGYGGRSSSAVTDDSEYDRFLNSQRMLLGQQQVPKRQRKWHLMQEIHNLEDGEDEEELALRHKLMRLKEQKLTREVSMNMMGGGGSGYGMSSYGGRYGGGYGGGQGYNDIPSLMSNMSPRGSSQRGSGGDSGRWGNGRNNRGPDGKTRRGTSRRGGKKNRDRRGRGSGQGNNTDKKDSGTPKLPLSKKKAKRLRQRREREVNCGQMRKLDITGRDERIKKLQTCIKEFPPRKHPAQTIHHCIAQNLLGIEVYFHSKSNVVFLDGLAFGQGCDRPYKGDAFTKAINKLKNSTLDEIKEAAKNMGELGEYPSSTMYPMHSTEEMRRTVTNIKYADMPFKERLEVFAESLKNHEHNMTCLRLYCTQYMINLRTVYVHHPDEEKDQHEFKVYANECFICSAKGAVKKYIEHQVLVKMYDELKNKTIDELMENDGRFTKDYPEYPQYISHRGVGYQLETNIPGLKFTFDINDFDALKTRGSDEFVMIEKKAFDGSWFKILEESANLSRLIIKCVWTMEKPPPGQYIEDTKTEGKEGEVKKEETDKKEEATQAKKEETTKIKEEEPKEDEDSLEYKRKEVEHQARKRSCMVIHCKLYLQDTLVGEGYGTVKNNATQMAAVRAHSGLFSFHSAIFHTPKSQNKRLVKWSELIKRAEELKETMPEAPVFDHIKDLGSDPLPDPNEPKPTRRNFDDSLVDPEKAKTLEPWVKEIVRSDIETFSSKDALEDADIFYRNMPLYVRDVAAHYCEKFNVLLKYRYDRTTIVGIGASKVMPEAKEIVRILLDSEDKIYHGYTLEQVRREDESVEVFHKIEKGSDNKQIKAIAGMHQIKKI